MKTLEKGIIISEDIDLILNGNNALGYSYKDKGIIVPSKKFIEGLRENFYKLCRETYGTDVIGVKESEMKESLEDLIKDVIDKYPIVSMDEIYIKPDNENIYSLDVTRLTGSSDLVTRKNPLDKNGVQKEVLKIAKELIQSGKDEIILLDDVIFSGSVVATISKFFKECGINVVGAISSISSNEAYEKFSNLKEKVKCGYLMKDDVIDEICERDFYYGIAQSGMAKEEDGKIYKAPYFLPFGDPVARASVPKDKAKYFSNELVKLSIDLWDETNRLSNREIMNYELPERILNTNENESVIKTLRKVLK